MDYLLINPLLLTSFLNESSRKKTRQNGHVRIPFASVGFPFASRKFPVWKWLVASHTSKLIFSPFYYQSFELDVKFTLFYSSFIMLFFCLHSLGIFDMFWFLTNVQLFKIMIWFQGRIHKISSFTCIIFLS